MFIVAFPKNNNREEYKEDHSPYLGLAFGIYLFDVMRTIRIALLTSEEHQLDGIEQENDLGVLFNSSLKFGNHIHKIVHKANRLLGLIKRTFSYLEPQMLNTTLIRPHLDYACVVWNLSIR